MSDEQRTSKKCLAHQERIADFADKWLMFENPPCPWCEIERLTSEVEALRAHHARCQKPND